MGVPRPFPTSTENSTSHSYDNGHIQKILARGATTPRPSIAPTYKAHNSSWNDKRTDTYTDREKEFIHKRLQELTNNTSYLLNNDFHWLSSANVTTDYSSLYEIPLPSKIHLVFTSTPTWKYYLSTPTILFLVLAVIKICLYYQHRPTTEYFPRRRLSEEQQTPSVLDTEPQPQNDTDPPPTTTSTAAIIINPEISTEDNAISDSPPLYSQCAVNNIGTVNIIVDNTSEELPPPYSKCVGPFNNTDDMGKVQKGQRIEEAQSYTETDRDRTNVERYDCTIEPLNRIVETAIDIDDCNNLISNSNKTDDENASS